MTQTEPIEGGATGGRGQRFVHTGSLILTPNGIWWTVNDEEPEWWGDGIESLFSILTRPEFELPEKFAVRLRRECGHCGAFYSFDRSCDCFDNGGQ